MELFTAMNQSFIQREPAEASPTLRPKDLGMNRLNDCLLAAEMLRRCWRGTLQLAPLHDTARNLFCMTERGDL